MNKIWKLLLYIVLSTCAMYFFVSNLTNFSNVKMIADFIQHGTQKDIVEYAKSTEEDFRKNLKSSEENTEDKDNNEEANKNEEKKDNTNNSEKNDSAEEKEYNTLEELAQDYPIGVTYYSMVMSRGELQIETLSVSIIYGMIIGIILFIFSTKSPSTLKQILIMYIISIVISVIVMEVVQIIILALEYGRFYLVGVQLQYIIATTAIFLFILAMYKAKEEKNKKKLEKEQENNSKSVKKDKKRK